MSSPKKKARAPGTAKKQVAAAEPASQPPMAPPAQASVSGVTSATPQKTPSRFLTWPALLLLGILVLGLVVRLLPLAFSLAGGHVVFSEFDPYYHLRRITYTVEHFPATNAYDSYVDYPNGYYVGWPPLFDLIGATAALIVGLGHPDRGTIELVAASLPVVLGLLAMVAAYVFVKDVINERAALASAFVMAFLPAAVLRSIFGFTDHHVLEVLLSLTMYVLFLRAVTKGSAKGLSLKTLAAGKEPLTYAALGGLAMAAMVLSWDGAPIFLVVILAYAFVQYALDAKRGQSSEHLTIAGVVASAVALAVVAPVAATTHFGQQFAVNAIYLSWFHIFMLGGMLGCFLLIELLRRAALAAKAPWYALPAGVLVLCGAAGLAVKVALPGMFASLESGLTYLRGGSLVLSSIAEVAPLLTFMGSFSLLVVWTFFSTAVLPALAGLGLYLYGLRKARLEAGTVFFLTWTAVVVTLGLLQWRFIYLLGACVAMYVGYAIWRVLDIAGLERLLSRESSAGSKGASTRLRAIATRNVAIAGVVFLLLLAFPAYQAVERFTQPEPYLLDWDNACQWIKENTPATSYLYAPDPGNVPEYGVMTIWDYGNYVLYRAERPAVANNFQTGIDDSMRFFVSRDEAAADALMEKRQARYVIVDRRMSPSTLGVYYGVFENMPTLAGEDVLTYFMKYRMPIAYSTVPHVEGSDKYYGSMFSRLYNDRGCGGLDGLGNVTQGLAHYRLLYTTNGTDPVAVFEKVKGATITGTASPGAKVEVSLGIETPREHLEYYSFTVADTSGAYRFTVPYPTGATGFVKTAGQYTLASGSASAGVRVTEDAVSQGLKITAGGL